MFGSAKNHSNLTAHAGVKLLLLAILIGAAGLLITACDMSLGLGDPVDTVAPTISIITPRDNEFMRGIAIGEPIQMAGTCYDDFGVTALKVKVTNIITGAALSPKFTYTFDSEETWRASLYLPGDGVAEYRIRVIALDKYRNEGADEVTVRVDLVAPWVREASVIRHSKFTSELKDINFYEDLSFRTSNMYKQIRYVNIDDFQNETFTVRLVIDFNLDHVAASRLDVYSEDGVKLNPLALKPTSEPTKETPEWRITRDELTGWNPRYNQGAQYIYFVAMAWNSTAWLSEEDGGTGFNGGGTKPGESYREQRINGTCWYPESDYPHISTINDISDGFITLTPNTSNAFSLQFFDDDKLAEIYAAIIAKEKMDEIRGGMTETAYLESLATDGTKRNAAITELSLANLFNPGASPDGREQTVNLGTGTGGEYRLFAMTRDDKSSPLDTVDGSLWTVHPPLRVQVQDPDDPIIMVESPALENSFPVLSGGRKFSISGFTIDNLGVDTVQIAWIPAGTSITVAQAQQALRDASLSDGSSTVLGNQMKIWRLAKGARSIMTLNGVNYIRDNFSQEFDILDDFKYNGQTQNDNKLFIIHAIKGTRNIYKNFNLTGNNEKPSIRVVYPYRDMLVHDTEQNLTLSMEVSSNIGLKSESIKISDKTAGNLDVDYGMSGMTSYGSTYQRTITADFIVSNFPEGSRRTYWFEAEDILGNTQTVERTIIMSNLPALQYITSSNAPGTYGIGTELRFDAVFSLPIKVLTQGGTGPRLKLYFKDPLLSDPGIPSIPSNPNYEGVYANYVTVAGNTIVFSYTVKEGDVAPLLYNSFNPIENSSTIETTEAGGGLATTVLQPGNGVQNRVQIGVDGIRPKIENAGFTQPETGEPYYNNGKTVTLELYASKRVRVSGTPTASISYGTGTATASFSKVTHDEETGKSTLFFTYMVDVGNNVQQSQLRWAAPWIQYSGTDSVSDMAGNDLDLGTASLPTGNALNGTSLVPPKPAYIITRSPDAPTFILYRNLNTISNTPVTILDNGLANNDIYIVINRNGASGTDLFYSLEAGNYPKEYSGTPNNYEKILDEYSTNKNSTDYVPSEYKIIAWQVDKAGNRSSNSAEQSVIINSRAPELVDITCTEPNGSYSTGKTLNFKLVFSRKVQLQPVTSPQVSASLTLKGTDAEYNSTVTISLTTTSNSAFDTSLPFTWQIPSGYKMKNIEATSIVLNGVYDEYGNKLKPYVDVGAEDDDQRPISSAPSLQRSGLIVDSVIPKIIAYNPVNPGTGELSNGGLMNKEPEASGSNKGMVTDATITLTFDKPLWAQSGKTITIRPWNNWAVPPVLTVSEMNDLYNSPLFGSNQTEYQRRLKWIDANGFSLSEFADRVKYNSYVFTTHGLNTEGSGNVRPDVSAKWVLAFDRDLYTGTYTAQLRDVFNTAQWKWQIISATSGSVVISGSTVTITLPEPLQNGRIWEVLMDEGAFRDAAGNESAAIVSTAVAGQGYRFWTKGTADPVIRVDKHSHGDSHHSLPESYRGDWSTRPFIDTKVRIDCETPGATIRYDTIRTKYTLPNAFSSTTGGTGFFSHTNVTNAVGGNTATGYTNNTIGNGGNAATPPSADGYFIGLLVPNIDETLGTTAANMVSQNGTVTKAQVRTRGTNLVSGVDFNTANGRIYRTIAASGTATYPNPVFNITTATVPETATGYFFYAGDAYKVTGSDAGVEGNRVAANDTDSALYTGRRDYVTSAAKKNAVTTAGETAGPALNISDPAYEGVFKTTVLYRQPGNGLYWVTIQGFDTPITPSTPGFPLQEYIATPPSPYNKIEHVYFSRQPWRVGTIAGIGGTVVKGTWPTGRVTNNILQYNQQTINGLGQADRVDNHIWVSWDIVSDWYIKGRNRGVNAGASATSSGTNDTLVYGRLQRAGYNYGAVLATYGAVTYRYRQHFDSSVNSSGTNDVTQ